jgi:hypothetical protein
MPSKDDFVCQPTLPLLIIALTLSLSLSFILSLHLLSASCIDSSKADVRAAPPHYLLCRAPQPLLLFLAAPDTHILLPHTHLFRASRLAFSTVMSCDFVLQTARYRKEHMLCLAVSRVLRPVEHQRLFAAVCSHRQKFSAPTM